MEHAIRGPQRMSGSWGFNKPCRDWHSLRRCMEHQGRRISVPGRVGSPGWPVVGSGGGSDQPAAETHLHTDVGQKKQQCWG